MCCVSASVDGMKMYVFNGKKELRSEDRSHIARPTRGWGAVALSVTNKNVSNTPMH